MACLGHHATMALHFGPCDDWKAFFVSNLASHWGEKTAIELSRILSLHDCRISMLFSLVTESAGMTARN